MTAITEKALDTSMQYDTETAWKSFGRVLKKVAADLKRPWLCAQILGGVSIFEFSPIFLNSNLILVSKINSNFALSNQPCVPPMLTPDSKYSSSDGSSQKMPSPDMPGQVQYEPSMSYTYGLSLISSIFNFQKF